jgi:hypothetical protein
MRHNQQRILEVLLDQEAHRVHKALKDLLVKTDGLVHKANPVRKVHKD